MKILTAITFVLLATAPALADPIIAVNGSIGFSCYQETLRTPLMQNLREGIAVCNLAEYRDFSGSPMDRASIFVNRADLRLKLRDYSGVVRDSDKAIAMLPDLAVAYLNRGAGLVGIKRNQEAIDTLSKAMSMGYDKPELAYFNRALAREAMGVIPGAYGDFKAAAANPKFDLAANELTRFRVVQR